MKTTVTVTNAVHGTSAQVRLEPEGQTILLKHTVSRLNRTLCPTKDCECRKQVLCGTGPFVVGESLPDGSLTLFIRPEVAAVPEQAPAAPETVEA